MNNFGQDCRRALQTEFDADAFDAFIQPASFDIEEDTLYVSSPNLATERWLRGNIESMLSGFIREHLGKPLKIAYRLSDARAGDADAAPAAADLPEQTIAPAYQPKRKDSANLLKKLTFSSFVPGRANEIPLIAAQNIAKGDSSVNPLFIYGGTGLGKTHLIHAIGNEYLKNFPSHRVLCVGARVFLNDVVQAFRLNQQERLKNRYHHLDLLIVDDIQYIGGDKVRTQEEFFFLFNSLYEQNKSIIISCDRAPMHIKDLPQRLTTRFSAGLPTHITPPEFELRIAILRQKARERNIPLGDDAVHFIAENVKSNVRELEGAINRVHAMARFQKTGISLDLCRRAMADLIGQANIMISPDSIKERVAVYYHVRAADLSSKKRHRSIVVPRHIAIYLCRQMTTLSLPEIGGHFGKRNHTTVLHSCRWVEEQIKNNAALWDEIKHIETSIRD